MGRLKIILKRIHIYVIRISHCPRLVLTQAMAVGCPGKGEAVQL